MKCWHPCEPAVVAVLRTENPDDLAAVSRALAAGGVKFVEITMTVPGALEILRDAVNELKGTDVFIGAGTENADKFIRIVREAKGTKA